MARSGRAVNQNGNAVTGAFTTFKVIRRNEGSNFENLHLRQNRQISRYRNNLDALPSPENRSFAHSVCHAVIKKRGQERV